MCPEGKPSSVRRGNMPSFAGGARSDVAERRCAFNSTTPGAGVSVFGGPARRGAVKALNIGALRPSGSAGPGAAAASAAAAAAGVDTKAAPRHGASTTSRAAPASARTVPASELSSTGPSWRGVAEGSSRRDAAQQPAARAEEKGRPGPVVIDEGLFRSGATLVRGPLCGAAGCDARVALPPQQHRGLFLFAGAPDLAGQRTLLGGAGSRSGSRPGSRHHSPPGSPLSAAAAATPTSPGSPPPWGPFGAASGAASGAGAGGAPHAWGQDAGAQSGVDAEQEAAAAAAAEGALLTRIAAFQKQRNKQRREAAHRKANARPTGSGTGSGATSGVEVDTKAASAGCEKPRSSAPRPSSASCSTTASVSEDLEQTCTWRLARVPPEFQRGGEVVTAASAAASAAAAAAAAQSATADAAFDAASLSLEGSFSGAVLDVEVDGELREALAQAEYRPQICELSGVARHLRKSYARRAVSAARADLAERRAEVLILLLPLACQSSYFRLLFS